MWPSVSWEKRDSDFSEFAHSNSGSKKRKNNSTNSDITTLHKSLNYFSQFPMTFPPSWRFPAKFNAFEAHFSWIARRSTIEALSFMGCRLHLKISFIYITSRPHQPNRSAMVLTDRTKPHSPSQADGSWLWGKDIKMKKLISHTICHTPLDWEVPLFYFLLVAKEK